MLKITPSVKGLKELQEYIYFVKLFLNDKQELSRYLGEKTLKYVKELTRERSIIIDGTPDKNNSEHLEEYQSNHMLEATANGFTITNNTTTYDGSYPFNIALAFEYGVGIAAEGSPVPGHWEYNINQYNFGWTFINSSGEKTHTYGHAGMEIYRFTKVHLQKNVARWIKEYISEKKRGLR